MQTSNLGQSVEYVGIFLDVKVIRSAQDLSSLETCAQIRRSSFFKSFMDYVFVLKVECFEKMISREVFSLTYPQIVNNICTKHANGMRT